MGSSWVPGSRCRPRRRIGSALNVTAPVTSTSMAPSKALRCAPWPWSTSQMPSSVRDSETWRSSSAVVVRRSSRAASSARSTEALNEPLNGSTGSPVLAAAMLRPEPRRRASLNRSRTDSRDGETTRCHVSMTSRRPAAAVRAPPSGRTRSADCPNKTTFHLVAGVVALLAAGLVRDEVLNLVYHLVDGLVMAQLALHEIAGLLDALLDLVTMLLEHVLGLVLQAIEVD